MSKAFLFFTALLLVVSQAVAQSPEAELVGMQEAEALIVESNKGDCKAMAEKLKSFAEDNKDKAKSIATDLAKEQKEGKSACQDKKSSECEDFMKKKWSKADIRTRGFVAEDKFRYYSRTFCADNADIAAADKILEDAVKAGFEEGSK
jgi:hypothetical protein